MLTSICGLLSLFSFKTIALDVSLRLFPVLSNSQFNAFIVLTPDTVHDSAVSPGWPGELFPARKDPQYDTAAYAAQRLAEFQLAFTTAGTNQDFMKFCIPLEIRKTIWWVQKRRRSYYSRHIRNLTKFEYLHHEIS